MTDAEITKHYQTSERSPQLRIRSWIYPGSATRFVAIEERGESEWYRIGSVEVGFGPADPRGACSTEVIGEWNHTRYHGNGDRVRVSRRLIGSELRTGEFEIVLEEEREEVLGSGNRDGHGWQERDSWRFEAVGGNR